MAFWNKRKIAKQELDRIRLDNENIRLRNQMFSTWYADIKATARSLKTPDLQMAMGLPAFNGAVNLLSKELSLLPIECYQIDRDNVGRVAYNSREARILKHQWNVYETAASGMFRFGLNLFSYGVAYAFVEKANGSSGPLQAVHVLNPLDVERKTTSDGLVYAIAGGEVVDRSRMVEVFWRPIGNMYPSYRSREAGSYYAPYELGWNAIKSGLLALSYSSDFYGSGSVPAYVFVNDDQPASTEALLSEQKDLEAANEEMIRKGARFITARAGTKAIQLGIDPESSLLVDMIRIHVEEIGRLFGVPPQLLQEHTRSTYSNAEQSDLHFQKHSLGPWARIISQELTAKVFGNQSRRFVELDVSSFNVGSLKERSESATRLVLSGVLTPNEARRMFGYPDIPDGDQRVLMPGAGTNQSAEAIVEADVDVNETEVI